MRLRLSLIFAVLGLISLAGIGRAANLLPDDPEAAWAEVDKVHQALRAPSQWRKQTPSALELVAFQEQVCKTAHVYADKAREFVSRFPANENCRDARITVVFALSHAVAAGDTNAEKQINAFVSGVLADKRLPEDDRVAVLMYSANTAFMKKAGIRIYTGITAPLQSEYEAAGLKATQAALRQFPTNAMLYTMLVAVAQRSSGDVQHKLALEILSAPGAPANVKSLATHLFEGSKPYVIGLPIQMRFTAFDGRDVDLAKLKGKVVLIYYWSATSGGCAAETLAVKALYDKVNARGFEVVGICMDDKPGPLRASLQANPLPWPQYYDGKGWQNQFGLQYGVFDVPTLWVVDRRGNLRNVDARLNLEPIVTSLLDERGGL